VRDLGHGYEPEVVGVPFWADSALLAAAGHPDRCLRPAWEGLHSEVEWVDVASLEQCVEIYGAVASELCR
jgi:acetylornithine deacetylase